MATLNGSFNGISSGAVATYTQTGTAVSVGDGYWGFLLYGDDVTTASINDPTNGANKDSLGNTLVLGTAVDLTTDGDLVYPFYCASVTHAGTPTIRFVASAGSHVFKAVGQGWTPVNAFSLDQTPTTGHSASATSLSAGTQTPTTTAGVAIAGFGTVGSSSFTHGTGWTVGPLTSDDWLQTEYRTYASTTALTGDGTILVAAEYGAVMMLFKDGSGGGPTTKSDTDTGTVSEQTPAIKLATPTDTATLTEQVPRISPTAQTDSFSFSETQTVTPSSAVSKTDTDTATLTEATNPPVIGVADSATLNDTAVTLVVTDVQQVPDFTVTEQTPRIGLAPTDSLTFTETQTLTASFIRFVDSDSFGLAEATTPMASISQRDTASLTETQAGTTYILDADTLSQSDAAAITALLTSLDALAFADTETRSIVGGYTGYAKGRLSVGARLAGTATVGTRLAGTTATGSRLKGTTTVQPVGGP